MLTIFKQAMLEIAYFFTAFKLIGAQASRARLYIIVAIKNIEASRTDKEFSRILLQTHIIAAT
jgi:hypothetical protein